MKHERMNELLHELAQEAIPNNVNLWQGVQTRIEAQRQAPGQLRLPVARLGWALAVLVVLLSFATAAYAIDPTVNKLFRQFVGLSTTDQSKYIQDLDLEQTIDGITVSVQAVYADASQIVIGMAVKRPAGTNFTASDFVLTTDDGTPLDMAMGMGIVGESKLSELMDVKLGPGEEAQVITFDASKIMGSPKRVKLHLSIKMREFTVIAIDPANATGDKRGLNPVIDGSKASGGSSNTLLVVSSDGVTTTHAFVGPFIFDLQVPFLAGRTVELHQKVTSAGVEMELAQVTITPSQIRATLCFTPPQPGAWTILAEMEPKSPIAGGVSMLPISGTSQECQTVRVPRPDVSTRDRTLKVNELLKFNAPFDGKQERIQGPWVFHLPQQ